MEKQFVLNSGNSPCGDQPKAIAELSQGLKEGKLAQVLLGVTGSGKTFTIANVIQNVQKPTLVLAHNKTLAAQLYQEFRSFFPQNAVEYFVSYYDYYQPEAYIARTDTYIEKDLAINDQIDRMRLAATKALVERRDVIIVASVSCIYGLGVPRHYLNMRAHVQKGQQLERNALLKQLVQMQYERREDLSRCHFRVRGDIVEILPAYEENLANRIEFFGDEVEAISEIDPITGRILRRLDEVTFYPATHHVAPQEVRESAVESIKIELEEQLARFADQNKLLEKERIGQRTRYDLEMIAEMGHCKGIENYSLHFDGRRTGSPPACLIDYFPDDFLLVVDESHQTLPQVRAMHNGDRARKAALIEFGFRLPSAFDNRPLKFEEFYELANQAIYVSATPAKWEIDEAEGVVVEQVLRPTGLLDPPIEVRPTGHQVDDSLEEIRLEVAKGGRVLVTALTKRLAEELSSYLRELGVRANYLHSEVDTVERVQILTQLRRGEIDVLVGINLLREGLDLPEVRLVVVLDADKEGFLRSATSLIQTAGRAARNSEGRVIFYADKKTMAIEQALGETARRRSLQQAHNEKNGIEPRTVQREIAELILQTSEQQRQKKSADRQKQESASNTPPVDLAEIEANIKTYESSMKRAAKEARFEDAARFRDLMQHYKQLQFSALTLESGGST